MSAFHKIVTCNFNKYLSAPLLDASLYGLGGSTTDSVHTVSTVVLLVIQEPTRIRQPSHMYSSVPKSLQ